MTDRAKVRKSTPKRSEKRLRAAEAEAMASTSESDRAVESDGKNGASGPDGAIDRRVYKYMVDSVPLPTFFKDTEGRYLYANQAALAMADLTLDQCIGHTDVEIYGPDLGKQIADADHDVLRRGKTTVVEYPPEFGGGPRQIKVTKSPFKDSEGKVIGLVGVATYILSEREKDLQIRRHLSFLNHSREAMVSIDLDGLIKEWNRAAQHVFGWTSQEVMGKHAAMLSPHQDQAAWEKEVRDRALETGEFLLDAKRVRKSGQVFPVEASIALITDEQNNPIGLTATIRDVTERLRGEELLRESEERYRVLTESSPDAVFVHRDGVFLFANQSAVKLLGGDTQDQITGKSVEDFVDPEYQHLLRDRIEKVKSSGKTLPLGEQRLRRLDGAPVPVEVIGTLITWSGEDAIHVIARDITERKKAENRFLNVFHTSPDAISLIELDRTVIGRNKAYQDMLGYSSEELQAMTYGQFTPKRWVKTDKKVLRRLLETGEVQEYEKEYIRKNGQVFPINIKIWLVENEIDGGKMILARVQDISERRQAVKELMRAKEKAEAANKAKSTFLSSMSHEFRTPLNAVMGYGQILMLDSGKKLDSQQNLAVAAIMEGGEQLLSLIDRVLELSRIEAGEILLSIEEVDPIQAVSECVNLIQGMAELNDITVNSLLDNKKAPLIRADHSRFKQVLNNFLSNAIKYNRPGGRVTVSAQPGSGDRLRVLITDTGPGIPEALFDQLFQPFSRLGKTHSNISGAGIGLTITKQIVEMMKGAVGFESTLGQGSTFWFELPLSNATEETDISFKTGKKQYWKNTAKRVCGSVLYIEDNPSNRELMKSVAILMPKVTLSTAIDGLSGLEKAMAERPDVILLDINLPDIDGFEVLKRLQYDPRTADIPVIAVSAMVMPLEVKRGLREGFKAYIAKPFDVSKIILALSEVLYPTSKHTAE